MNNVRLKQDNDSIEIIAILDRSGSMSDCATDMMGGFDQFIQAQRELPGEVTVTLAQFDNEYEVVYNGMPISDVPPLSLVPRGSTGLLDAIGRTINTVSERLVKTASASKPSKVLCIVMTDGHENCSREFKKEQIAELVKGKEENEGWEFVFLGADIDGFTGGTNLGFKGSSSISYGKGAMLDTFEVLSNSAASYRSSTSKSFSWTDKKDEEDK